MKRVGILTCLRYKRGTHRLGWKLGWRELQVQQPFPLKLTHSGARARVKFFTVALLWLPAPPRRHLCWRRGAYAHAHARLRTLETAASRPPRRAATRDIHHDRVNEEKGNAGTASPPRGDHLSIYFLRIKLNILLEFGCGDQL